MSDLSYQQWAEVVRRDSSVMLAPLERSVEDPDFELTAVYERRLLEWMSRVLAGIEYFADHHPDATRCDNGLTP